MVRQSSRAEIRSITGRNSDKESEPLRFEWAGAGQDEILPPNSSPESRSILARRCDVER